MGPRFIPIVVLLAIGAFAVAAASMAVVPDVPRLWSAAVALIILGGITPMIYAVNIRVVPVFSRRTWRHPRLLYAGVSLGIAGGWLVYLGRAIPNQIVEVIGHGLTLDGGLLFIASMITLLRSPASPRPTLPQAPSAQVEVDRIGVRFTRLSSVYLLMGLIVGLVSSIWTPDFGRWDLVWAHTMLLGWFLMMASGISYHVLSRWTGERWRSTRHIQAHLLMVTIGLPLMVAALALDLPWLFVVAGPLQAAALLLFVWNVTPLIFALPEIPRLGLTCALSMLTVGVLLGASVAVDPLNHTRLRFAHAELNLLGWAGLLVCGMGYYLFPRFAGQPLRWPRLAKIQLLMHATGAITGAVAWWWYLAVDDGARLFIMLGGFAVSGSFVAFAGIIAMTFRRSGTVVTEVKLYPRRSLPVR